VQEDCSRDWWHNLTDIAFRQLLCLFCSLSQHVFHFYRAMHFSAKRGIAIACHLSVCDVVEL